MLYLVCASIVQRDVCLNCGTAYLGSPGESLRQKVQTLLKVLIRIEPETFIRKPQKQSVGLALIDYDLNFQLIGLGLTVYLFKF